MRIEVELKRVIRKLYEDVTYVEGKTVGVWTDDTHLDWIC